jgi:hypothetical protein
MEQPEQHGIESVDGGRVVSVMGASEENFHTGIF